MSDNRDLNYPPIDEPQINPLEDTTPSLPMRPEATGARQGLSGWRRAAGLMSLLAAAGFTLATVLILMSSGNAGPSPAPPTQDSIELTLPPTLAASQPPTTETSQQPKAFPTISPEIAAAILSQPLAPVEDAAASPLLVSAPFTAFTTIPDRPRSEVVHYTAVQGDTIYSIAQRFGLKPETIAWSNPRRLIRVLLPGDDVTILPVDGVYYTAIGGKSITEIAKAYKIDDPYKIIDSEFNMLRGATPENVPPSGMKLVIPGGQAEEITWNPGVVREEGGENGTSNANYITFAPGQPGSCGRVINPGGGAYWVNPLPNGTYMRGFSSWHTGIDLAAPEGTPVMAANGGRVIYRGWNSWGYGYTVVLAHGPFTTLYGHLSSINVSCGQDVSPGQVIAGVGNTGNSSGPHLHFEILYNDSPFDPATTVAF